MDVVLAIGVGWVALSLPAAVLMGRAIRAADRREEAARVLMIPDFLVRAEARSAARAAGR